MNTALIEGKTPLQLFREVAFELKGYDDEVVQAHINLADMMFSAECYGELAPLFLAFMAAHLMVIPGGVAASSNSSSGGGPAGVKSIKEGDLQITYTDGTEADKNSGLTFKQWLNYSRFGQMIIQMRRSLGLGHGIMTRGSAPIVSGDSFHFPNAQLDYQSGRGR